MPDWQGGQLPGRRLAALSNAERATVMDCHPFLPESWTSEHVRCTVAKIPEPERRTKPELALNDAGDSGPGLRLRLDLVGFHLWAEPTAASRD